MTRNHGWRFLDMGRRLERAQHLAELLRSLLARGEPAEDGGLVLLLELADSIMTYRSRYLTTPMLPPVIDLLLLDETNPRSIAFQLAALDGHVDALPRDADWRGARASSAWSSLLDRVLLADIAALCGRARRAPAPLEASRFEPALPRLVRANRPRLLQPC